MNTINVPFRMVKNDVVDLRVPADCDLENGAIVTIDNDGNGNPIFTPDGRELQKFKIIKDAL